MYTRIEIKSKIFSDKYSYTTHLQKPFSLLATDTANTCSIHVLAILIA